MSTRSWRAAIALGLALTMMPLAGIADETTPPSAASPSAPPATEPSEPGTESPSGPPSVTETPATETPATETPATETPAVETPEAEATPPAVEQVPVAPAAVAVAGSGTMELGSSPAGFPLRGTYHFTGTADPGTDVTVWWDAQPSGGWRVFGTTTADADGAWSLDRYIGSVAAFRFVATGGNVPDADGWTSEVAYANAGSSSVLRVTSSPTGFAVGSHYVFTGTATPRSKVTVFWDVQPYGGWRVFGTTTADATGDFRIVVPLGSTGRFRFTATTGSQPDAGAPGAWQTNPSYVNAVLPGTIPGVLGVTSSPSGFYVGHNYVFTGRTTPGMPVTIWWDAAPFRNWRVFATTRAAADGFYRVVMPIGSAAQFKFAASSGHNPDTRTSDGWQTAAVPLTATVYVPPTMTLDARCKTGRVICISKAQNKLSWVVNGQIQFVLDARFGSSKLPTRNGSFKVTWKSRNHVSSIYGSAMPFSLFFDGGRAVHYSRSFYEFGWAGTSAGCVNTRDYEMTGKLFDLARVGDKVIVY